MCYICILSSFNMPIFLTFQISVIQKIPVFSTVLVVSFVLDGESLKGKSAPYIVHTEPNTNFPSTAQ